VSVGSKSDLRAEIERLRAENEHLLAELGRHEREASAREQQLHKYAHDLNETFKQEKARREELQRAYRATVIALSELVEARDAYTSKHAERVTAYALVIAQAAGLQFASPQQMEFGFLLHDVGKVAIPDAILYKPDRLSAEERLVMEQHPVIGSQTLSGFLGEAAGVVRSHHERWDGRGYPDGLAGKKIPIAARVFAVADVFDALTTDRPYRPASPIAVAREMITAESDTQFDPAVVNAFNNVPDDVFERIAAEMR
jgi:ribonuclease P protein subunit RPR2